MNKRTIKKLYLMLLGSCLLACFAKAETLNYNALYKGSLTDNYKQENACRSKICLNGVWKLALEKKVTKKPPVNPDDYAYVMVPSSWMDTADFPLKNSSHFKAGSWNKNGKWKGLLTKEYPYGWYVRKFIVPKNWEGKQVYLKLDRVTISGTIFVNGKKVGSQNEREEAEWNITPYLKKNGENTLSVRIAAYMDEVVKLFLGAEMTSKKKMTASLRGITQDVWLMTKPEKFYINDVFIHTSFRNKKIFVDVELKNPKQIKENLKISVGVISKKSGKIAKTITKEANLNGSKLQTVKISDSWSNPVLWEMDNPHLYEAKISVSTASEKVDESFPVAFGFREFWIDGKNMILNGKPFHGITLHIASHDAFINAARKNAKRKIDLYRKAGYNSLQLGSEGVWHKGHSAQAYNDILTLADEMGLPVFMPVAPVNAVHMDDPAEREKWEIMVKDYLRKYRNHPSVAMWSLNFNYLGYSWDMNPHTLGTGYRPPDNLLFLGSKRAKAKISEDFVRGLDPSREAYHHAGGNYGVMSTSNFYPAWLPLQEREDYMSKWSAKGRKPFFAVELGIPSMLDFLRARTGNYNTVRYSEMLEAEYSASYIGGKAFSKQGDDYLEIISAKATDKRAAGCDKYNVNSAYFWGYRMKLHDPVKSAKAFIYPKYIRGWRTYGMSGYSPNAIDTDIRGKDWQPWHGVAGTYSYSDWTAPGAKPLTYYIPDTDNKLSELGTIYAKAQKPVLVYLGGKKANGFSSKDHAFFAGEKVEKQLVVVNDLRKDISPEVSIRMVDSSGREIASQKVSLNVKAGEQGFKTVYFNMPHVTKRTELEFKLKAEGVPASKLGLWNFAAQVFPKQKINIKGKIALFDSSGDTSAAFEAAGINFERLNANTDLTNVSTIVIGRKSLKDCDNLMSKIFSAVAKGKTLLCLEQSDLKNFGLRVHERGVRRAFINGKDAVLKGFKDVDFSDWRGSSDMNEAYPAPSRITEDRYPEEPWKWGNKGVICSYMIEKPHIGNFKPLLECEFDLGYTPLLKFKEGKGQIILCQLDVTKRLNSDPVARKLLAGLLNSKSQIAKTSKVYAFSSKLREKLQADGVSVTSRYPENHGVIVWKGDKLSSAQKKQIIKSVKNGIKFLLIGQKALNDSAWLPVNMKTKRDIFYRAEPVANDRLINGISIADLFIKNRHLERIAVATNKVKVLTKPGIIAEAEYGKGSFIWLTVDPDVYKDSKITPERMNRIYTKLKRVQSILIANSGGRLRTIGKKFLSGNMLDNIKLPAKWRFSIDPRNKGRRRDWMSPDFDDSGWKYLHVPGYWESQGINDANNRFPEAKRPYDGYAWYRCKVIVPQKYKGRKLKLMLGAIDDMDTTYFNGEQIAYTGTETKDYYAAIRDYKIPENLIKYGQDNTIAIKVYDNKGRGGIVGPKLYIHTVSQDNFPYLNDKTPFNPYKLKRW